MKYPVLLLVTLCFGLAAAKCKYRRSGDWTACSAEGLKTRTDVLKEQKSDPTCHPTRNISKACREDCQYERRRLATWGECDQMSSTVTGTRNLVSGTGCPATVTEVFDCRVQRRFDRKSGRRAARKGQKKAQRKAQRRQNKQDKQQRRLARKQRRQQRQQNRQAAQAQN
ncbi:uncharacterized protein LOC122375129 [Amphibalanus amphitrite]|uniref:uncharacterized protein LOC122364091 n=1 Tax=Amphibalanus amphitrite TaxID=1232801 RepID=UPI001C918F07|nr:uncharacterized protein LOC122364091 [Amphibalanus amphitrite]XP_043210272.1 uncharacterized protein LOC122375129 [Amphibalanus amphitrite]